MPSMVRYRHTAILRTPMFLFLGFIVSVASVTSFNAAATGAEDEDVGYVGTGAQKAAAVALEAAGVPRLRYVEGEKDDER